MSSPPQPADFEKSFLTLTTHPSERSTSIRVTGTLCTYTVYVSHPPSRIYSYMCVEGLKLASVSSSNNNSCFQRRLSNFCPITHPRHRVLNVSTNENKKKFWQAGSSVYSTQKWSVKFASKNPNFSSFCVIEFVINSLSYFRKLHQQKSFKKW